MRQSHRAAGNQLAIPDALWEGPFLRACRGEPVSHTPIWLMRQAGRYMQEYRDIRAGRSFLELCKDTDLACTVTVDAQRILGTDAAIIFADILLVLETLGLGLEYVQGDGPKILRPIARAADVDALGDPVQAAADCTYVAEAIATTRAALPADCPLIGFCGAPFTLASYAIEGGGSRQFAKTRALMYGDPDTWHRLCAHLVRCLVPYAQAQIAAGAQCFQVFDSWAGVLPRHDYEDLVLPHLRDLVQALPSGVPVIVFGTHTGHLLPCFQEAGADVVGIDSTTDLSAAWDALGGPAAISVMGNLDPGLLLAPKARLLDGASRVLAAAAGRPGHIFNLGHGVFKETDPANAIALVQHVQRASAR